MVSKTAAQRPLRVPPGRARVIEVRYTATTFIDSDKTLFRCRLTGDHENWREMDTRRMAVSTNLRPGDYRFEIQAVNYHGYSSEQSAEFAFALEPRFVETSPFYAGCFGLAASTLSAWSWRKVRIWRRLERLERDRAVEAERNRRAFST